MKEFWTVPQSMSWQINLVWAQDIYDACSYSTWAPRRFPLHRRDVCNSPKDCWMKLTYRSHTSHSRPVLAVCDDSIRHSCKHTVERLENCVNTSMKQPKQMMK